MIPTDRCRQNQKSRAARQVKMKPQPRRFQLFGHVATRRLASLTSWCVNSFLRVNYVSPASGEMIALGAEASPLRAALLP